MALENCPLCGGKLERRIEKNELGEFEYDECLSCSERFYFESIMDAIDRSKVQWINFTTSSTRTDGSWYPITPMTGG